MLRGFKNFLMQGDLIIIAVGLVVALAFSTLIKAFTDNIITPLVNAVGGGAAGEGLGWTINGQRIDLGASWCLTGSTCDGAARPCSANRHPPKPSRSARHPICPSTPPAANTAPRGSPPSPKRATGIVSPDTSKTARCQTGRSQRAPVEAACSDLVFTGRTSYPTPPRPPLRRSFILAASQP